MSKSIKEIMLSKTSLETDTVVIAGCEFEIRELMGSERADMLRAETPEEGARICWNGGVLDESQHMDKEEFAQAWKFNYNLVDQVGVAICKLSGYFDTDEDDAEKEKN